DPDAVRAGAVEWRDEIVRVTEVFAVCALLVHGSAIEPRSCRESRAPKGAPTRRRAMIAQKRGVPRASEPALGRPRAFGQPQQDARHEAIGRLDEDTPGAGPERRGGEQRPLPSRERVAG